ncbi:MAG: glutamate 5-kinase [Patescibacteria group bacterium]
MYKRVIIKIGSGVISKEGQFDAQAGEHIVEQIVSLNKTGVEIVLITSGAVATGRGILKLSDKIESIVQKQVFASVGQVKLMSFYADIFGKRGYICAQVLVTKEDFRDRQHYLNMKNCFENLLQGNVVPVVNENDVIAITELIFTDNDELAGLIASQLNADAVIILTSVDGVLDGNPNDPKSQVIAEIDFTKNSSFEKYITNDKSVSGRGGMHTKFGIAKKLAAQGITTHIASGKRQNTIVDLVEGKSVGTKFIPNRKLSATKRRLAYSAGLSKGVVYVNKRAEDVLLSKKAISLLPVGIVRVEGVFEKGDVIEIKNETKKKLGFGIAQYDSQKANDSIGKKKIRALVHYDYMFLE